MLIHFVRVGDDAHIAPQNHSENDIKGRSLLQSVPSCKNSPPDYFCNSTLAERTP